MSCWIVDKEDIDAIVYGVRKWAPGLTLITNGERISADTHPDTFGTFLWHTNVDAYCDRYDEPRDYDAYQYRYDRDADYDMGQVYGALRCYRYQASDKVDWFRCEAKRFCAEFERCLLMAAIKELGYAIPWGVNGIAIN